MLVEWLATGCTTIWSIWFNTFWIPICVTYATDVISIALNGYVFYKQHFSRVFPDANHKGV